MPIRLKVVTEPRPGDTLFPYNLMILALEEAIVAGAPAAPVASGAEVPHSVDLAVPPAALAPTPASSPAQDRIGVVQDGTQMGNSAIGFTLLSWNRVRLGGNQGIRIPVRRDPGGGSTFSVVVKSRTLEATPTTAAGTQLLLDEVVNLT